MYCICYSFLILMKLYNFLDRFSKNTQISNFMITHLVEDEVLYADRRKDNSNEILIFAILRTHLQADNK
jgi:hypothetical protein